MKLVRTRRTTIIAAAAAAVMLSAGIASASAHWTYEGVDGPAYWSELDPAYAACSDGSAQSPINITHPRATPLKNLKFSYTMGIADVTNNGHTVQANANPGSTMTVNGTTYPLLQIHFHAPGEHEVNGKKYPVEVHFVHKTDAGAIAVVGVLIEEGRHDNKNWEPLVKALSVPVNGHVSAALNWSAMLPENQQTFRYAGSLTTPPCSEGVAWNVMATPVKLSHRQIEAFMAAYEGNFRPVQPLNNRSVLFDSSEG